MKKARTVFLGALAFVCVSMFSGMGAFAGTVNIKLDSTQIIYGYADATRGTPLLGNIYSAKGETMGSLRIGITGASVAVGTDSSSTNRSICSSSS